MRLQAEVASLQAALRQAQAAVVATPAHRDGAAGLEHELAAARGECQRLQLELERVQQREQEVAAAASGSDAAVLELQSRCVATAALADRAAG